MAEDSKTWLKRVRDRIESSGIPFSDEELERLVREITIQGVAATHHDWNQISQEERNAVAREATKAALASDQYKNMKQIVRNYNERDNAGIEERKLLSKIENGQGFRALFWRTLTTLVAVSIVFGAYALAAKYEIPLPLSRLQLNGA